MAYNRPLLPLLVPVLALLPLALWRLVLLPLVLALLLFRHKHLIKQAIMLEQGVLISFAWSLS
jgi:hypothetical protein